MEAIKVAVFVYIILFFTAIMALGGILTMIGVYLVGRHWILLSYPGHNCPIFQDLGRRDQKQMFLISSATINPLIL